MHEHELAATIAVIPSRADRDRDPGGADLAIEVRIALALNSASRMDDVPLAQANRDCNCEVPRRLRGSG